MKTDRDGREYVLRAIAPEGGPESHDVDAIVAELRELADGWDFDKVSPEQFWTIVAVHDRDDYPEPKSIAHNANARTGVALGELRDV